MNWKQFLRWIGDIFQHRPQYDVEVVAWYEVTSDGDNLRHLLAVPMDTGDPHRYQYETLWEVYQERHWCALLDAPMPNQARMMLWSRRVNVVGNN